MSAKESRIPEAVDDTTADLRRLGFIDKRKQRDVKALVLKPVRRYEGKQIRALREREQQWICAEIDRNDAPRRLDRSSAPARQGDQKGDDERGDAAKPDRVHRIMKKPSHPDCGAPRAGL